MGVRFRCNCNHFTLYSRLSHRYGIIDKFVRLGDNTDGFAVVRWFGKPVYLYCCRLVVKIRSRFRFDSSLPSVISVKDIDPSRIICELCDGDGSMFVMRIEGIDTIKP